MRPLSIDLRVLNPAPRVKRTGPDGSRIQMIGKSLCLEDEIWFVGVFWHSQSVHIF
jgi:hypothetical protein